MEHKFVYNKISLTPGSLYLVRLAKPGIRAILVAQSGKSFIIDKYGLGKEIKPSDISEIIYSTDSLTELYQELTAMYDEQDIKRFSIDPKKLKPGVKVKLPSLKLTAEITNFGDNKDGTYDVSLKFDSIKDVEKYLGRPMEEVYSYKDLSDPTIDEVWSKGSQLDYWELA